MSSRSSDDQYHESLMRLIREMTGVARALKAFDESSESDPRTASLPPLDSFPKTGLREIDTVANMFAVTYHVLNRHVGRLQRLLTDEPTPAALERATVLVCVLNDQSIALFRDEAEAAVESLGRYGALMALVAERNRGAFLALGGASFIVQFRARPGDSENGAVRACRTGLEILAALDQFNTYRTRLKTPPFRCSVGIHTGDVCTGGVVLGGKSAFVVVGPAMAGAAAAQRQAAGEVRPLLLTATAAKEAGDLIKFAPLEDRTVQVGQEKIPLFAISQPPPHVDYRAMLDEMFGVALPSSERDDEGEPSPP